MQNISFRKRFVIAVSSLLLSFSFMVSTIHANQPGKILFILGSGYDESVKIKNVLWQMGYTHESIDLNRPSDITRSVLGQFEMIIWPDGDIGSKYFSTEKLEAIVDFVKNGGSLFIGLPFKPEGINSLIGNFGAQSNGDLLGKVWSHYLYTQHPVSEGVRGLIYWRRDEPGIGVEAAKTLSIRNPAIPIFWVENSDPSSSALVSAAEVDRGRVVVMGGLGAMRTFTYSDYLARGDTSRLLKNIINWLTHK